MKKLFLALITFSFIILSVCHSTSVNAQGVSINATGAPADSSAMLDVSSTVKGTLITRMTTAQRNAINSPATGLQIYNTDCNNFNYYNGTAWVAINAITAGLSIAASPTGAICLGTSVTFTATQINGGITPIYQWIVNGSNVGTNSTAYSYIPVNGDVVSCVLTSNAPCVMGSPAISNLIIMKVTTLPTATISYSGTPYCSNAGIASVTFSGTSGGTYSASPAGLSINSSTGAVTTGSSTAGNYTVTYTIAASGGCPQVTATTPITITTLPVATFSYSGTPYCSNAANPSPTFSGGGVAGTFSSTAGLVFVSTATGQVNLSASTPGTYTVTNAIAASGGCGVVTATSPITITTLPVATFSYTGTPYCFNAANPSPTFSGGGVAGTFSSTAGLTFVDTTTGQVNLSGSIAGTYTVTNTIAASGGCGVVTASSPITITGTIVLDTISNLPPPTTTVTTTTFTITTTYANEIILVDVQSSGGGSTFGGLTVDAVAATLVSTITGNNTFMVLYACVPASTGSHTITITWGQWNSGEGMAYAASFSGFCGTPNVAANVQSITTIGTTTVNGTITPATANSYLFADYYNWTYNNASGTVTWTNNNLIQTDHQSGGDFDGSLAIKPLTTTSPVTVTATDNIPCYNTNGTVLMLADVHP